MIVFGYCDIDPLKCFDFNCFRKLRKICDFKIRPKLPIRTILNFHFLIAVLYTGTTFLQTCVFRGVATIYARTYVRTSGNLKYAYI